MNALQIADELMKFYNLEENTAPIQIYDLAATILRQQQAEIEALKAEIVVIEKNTDYWADKSSKTLTDEVLIKAFDCYCETDEGVLKFDLELRDEWKKEQLIRWKEALRKAQEK
jgi:hypothetical protein